tara:strand:- start:195 stop:437 length:243 start_codon:yes stop_codon:yes gene_type:complete
MRKGATLIENITVILCIAILVSVLVPVAGKVYYIFQRMMIDDKLYIGKEDPNNYIKRESDGLFYHLNHHNKKTGPRADGF